MEDKNERAGFPERAVEHFDGFIKSIEDYPREDRDKYWWAWTSQFGNELEEAWGRGLLTKGQVEDIKKRVRDFVSRDGNKKEFEEAMEFFKEKDVEEDCWWEDE